MQTSPVLPTAAPALRPLDADLSRRIEQLRFLLILGIVYVHVPPTYALNALPPEAWTALGALKLFVSHALLRSGVVTLSLISGFLLTRQRIAYPLLLARKARTLLLPFVLWNGLVVLLKFATAVPSRGLGGALSAQLHGLAHPLTAPPDLPTYFLVSVFLCMAVAPALIWLLRRAPLLTLATGFILVSLGLVPLPDLRWDILLAFACGLALGLHGVELRCLDRWWRPLSLVFLLACVAFTIQTLAGADGPLNQGVLRALGAATAWSAASAIPPRLGLTLARQGRFAFLVFCAHYPLLHLVADHLPKHGPVPWLFFFVAPPMTVGLILAIGTVLERRAPHLLGISTGARLTQRHRLSRAPDEALGSERAAPVSS